MTDLDDHYQRLEGAQVRMECVATSDKDVNVELYWMFNNQILFTNEKYQINTRVSKDIENSHDNIRTISQLEIGNVAKDDDGIYTCLANSTNKFLNYEKEHKIFLNVQYRPR